MIFPHSAAVDTWHCRNIGCEEIIRGWQRPAFPVCPVCDAAHQFFLNLYSDDDE